MSRLPSEPAIDDENDPPDPPERPLVVRARSDRTAFGERYDRTHGMIYRYCRRRIGEAWAAEDACSAVFVAIAERMSGFPGATEEDFRRWAIAIARRQTASMLRKADRRDRLLRRASENGTLSQANPDAPSEGADDRHERLSEALARLSEREQTLVDLRYAEGMPHDAIARTLGMRSGAVRTAIVRALRKLRHELSCDVRGPS